MLKPGALKPKDAEARLRNGAKRAVDTCYLSHEQRVLLLESYVYHMKKLVRTPSSTRLKLERMRGQRQKEEELARQRTTREEGLRLPEIIAHVNPFTVGSFVHLTRAYQVAQVVDTTTVRVASTGGWLPESFDLLVEDTTKFGVGTAIDPNDLYEVVWLPQGSLPLLQHYNPKTLKPFLQAATAAKKAELAKISTPKGLYEAMATRPTVVDPQFLQMVRTFLVEEKGVTFPGMVNAKAAKTKRKAPEIRTWFDSKGKRIGEASFGGAISGNVRLKKADGSVLTVRLDELSEADRLWIKGRRR